MTETAVQVGPRVVEVRTPSPEAGHGKAWCKTVTAVAATAKTGHDWQGDFVRCNRLVDARQGDVFLSCGFSGSRKHGCKYAKLWVVLGDGLRGLVGEVVSDEWAIELRDVARKYLEMGWRERCLEGIQNATVLEEKALPQPVCGLEEWRAAAEQGWRQGERFWSVSSEVWTDAQSDQDRERLEASLKQCPGRLADMEKNYIRYLREVEAWTRMLDDLRTEFAGFRTPPLPAEPVPSWAADVSDYDLLAEVCRRGLTA